MNEFVEDCRSEWTRLGVADSVAEDMAAELAADLEEAAAEGASPEEVLGAGALDPRAFAAAWAAERGVMHQPPSRRRRHLRIVLMAAATGAFAASAIAGALVVILASPSTSRSASPSLPRRVTLDGPPLGVRGAVWVRPLPKGAGPVAVRVDAPDGTATVLAVDGRSITLHPAPAVPRVAVDVDDSGVDAETLGSVLLIAGLAGLIPFTLYWLLAGTRRRAPAS